MDAEVFWNTVRDSGEKLIIFRRFLFLRTQSAEWPVEEMLSQMLVQIQKQISTPLIVLEKLIRKIKVLFGIVIKVHSLWISAYQPAAK